MPRKFNDILDDLEAVLVAAKQTTITGPNFDPIDNLCIEFLRERGYSVIKPTHYPLKVTKLDDIINLFYLLFNKHYPTFAAPYNSEARDRKIAKLFIESRMKADGISRTKALEQCAAIIETVFKNKDSFNFDPYPTFGVFGQQKLGWITEKALGFVNKDLEKFKEIETDKKIEAATIKLEESDMQIGWGDDVIDQLYNKIMEEKGNG